MSVTIDLNADLGEGFSLYRVGDDVALLDVVTSCNVACGFHAGDPDTMRRTVRLAAARGVSIGAHPSLPDRQGFGRREMRLEPTELHAMTLYQIGALAGFAREAGTRVRHVKPHGALYHQLSTSAALAEAFVDAMRAFDPALVLYARAGSAFAGWARERGCRVVGEAFVDRAYRADGNLADRGTPGAVLDDDRQRVAQALALARERRVTGFDASGVPVDVAVDAGTLCLHGDSPGAAATAVAIRTALSAAGVSLASPL
jgi:5-oxoprolinase (ATP-hydrolysing) subunit A